MGFPSTSKNTLSPSNTFSNPNNKRYSSIPNKNTYQNFQSSTSSSSSSSNIKRSFSRPKLAIVQSSVNELPSVFDSDSDSEESEIDEEEEDSQAKKAKILRMIRNRSSSSIPTETPPPSPVHRRSMENSNINGKGKFREMEEGYCYGEEDPFEIVVEDEEAEEDLFESNSTSPKTRHSSTLSSTSTNSSSSSISIHSNSLFEEDEDDEDIDEPIFTPLQRKVSLSPFSPLIHPRYPTLFTLHTTSPPYSPDSALRPLSILSARYQRALSAFENFKLTLPEDLSQDERESRLEDSKQFKEAIRCFWEVKRWMDRKKESEMKRWNRRVEEVRLGRMVVGYEQEMSVGN